MQQRIKIWGHIVPPPLSADCFSHPDKSFSSYFCQPSRTAACPGESPVTSSGNDSIVVGVGVGSAEGVVGVGLDVGASVVITGVGVGLGSGAVSGVQPARNVPMVSVATAIVRRVFI